MKRKIISAARTVLFLALCGGCMGSVSRASDHETTPERMNILFFLVDDLGYKDIVANRTPETDGPTIYETPAADRLAADGMTFTQAYSNGPRCVVSRVSMMSGNYHFKPVEIDGEKIYPSMKGLKKRPFFSELLQDAGYHTGYIGKWHLGNTPLDKGFDFSIGGGSMGSPGKVGYFAPYDPEHVPGMEHRPKGEYLTDALTDEAVGFLQRHVAKDTGQPFFLCLSHYAVHTPIEAKEEDIAYFRKKKEAVDFGVLPEYISYYTAKMKVRQDNETYAAMCRSMDESLQKIRKELDALGLSDNTIIVFTSDHGGKAAALPKKGKKGKEVMPTSNYPLRAGKGWIYEGGLRIPMFVYWPGVTQAGSRSEAMVLGSDLFSTFLDMAEVPPQPQLHLDSISFAPAFKAPEMRPRNEAYFYFHPLSANGNMPMQGYRKGDYKYLVREVENEPQLFNIREDESESVDLVKKLPELAREMDTQLRQYLDGIGAEPYERTGSKYEQALDRLKANGILFEE